MHPAPITITDEFGPFDGPALLDPIAEAHALAEAISAHGPAYPGYADLLDELADLRSLAVSAPLDELDAAWSEAHAAEGAFLLAYLEVWAADSAEVAALRPLVERVAYVAEVAA